MDLSKISIVEKEKRCLVTVDIDPDITFEKEVELITAQTSKYQLGRLHDASYGSMIPVESIQNAWDEGDRVQRLRAGVQRSGAIDQWLARGISICMMS